MMTSDGTSHVPDQKRGFPPFKIRVLLVDDRLMNAEALRRMLRDQHDIEFHSVGDAEAAIATATDLKPTVILQNLAMPDMDGLELVRRFRLDPDTRDVPIVVLSTKEDAEINAHAFAAGANDYLTKLPDKLELLARIRCHSTGYISRLERDGAFRALRENQQQLAEANIKLRKLIDIDGLTGIANRRHFDEVLASEWQRGVRSQRTLSLLLCNIDFFRLYNDTHGHLAGDLCLQKVAQVLHENLRRPADLSARYGGEEFAMILPETEREGALVVAETCRQQVEALAMSNHAPNTAPVVTISLGVASMIPSHELSPADLIAIANRALYQAKDGGRNRAVSAP